MTITDWRQLEVGQFVKLSCGCEGKVIRVEREGEPPDRGFVLAYTTELGCHPKESAEKTYRKGYGPYTNYFNYDLCDDALPIELVEKPKWWDDVAAKWRPEIREYTKEK